MRPWSIPPAVAETRPPSRMGGSPARAWLPPENAMSAKSATSRSENDAGLPIVVPFAASPRNRLYGGPLCPGGSQNGEYFEPGQERRLPEKDMLLVKRLVV